MSLVLKGLLRLVGIAAAVVLSACSPVEVRGSHDENLAITRAEAVNMATAAFIQSRGRENAAVAWDKLADDEAKYRLLTPFLAFAPPMMEEYMPASYSIKLAPDLRSLEKVKLTGPDGLVAY